MLFGMQRCPSDDPDGWNCNLGILSWKGSCLFCLLFAISYLSIDLTPSCAACCMYQKWILWQIEAIFLYIDLSNWTHNKDDWTTSRVVHSDFRRQEPGGGLLDLFRNMFEHKELWSSTFNAHKLNHLLAIACCSKLPDIFSTR